MLHYYKEKPKRGRAVQYDENNFAEIAELLNLDSDVQEFFDEDRIVFYWRTQYDPYIDMIRVSYGFWIIVFDYDPPKIYSPEEFESRFALDEEVNDI